MKSSIQIHGHRGCRGYYPENTIEGFKRALALGATAIELDVVVSSENELIVSHEPYMNSFFCRKPTGEPIQASEEKIFNLYEMSSKEIKSFDCGHRIDNKYPKQLKVNEYKPTLQETIDALPPDTFFNIEIKSEPQWYGGFQPEPVHYAKLVASFLDKNALHKRCLIQSFDPNFLNELKPFIKNKVPIGFLVEYEMNPEEQLKQLNFIPNYFNPEHILLSKEHLIFLKSKGIKTLVWTVNEIPDIQKMIALGVDGIISDYPDRVVQEHLKIN